MKNKKIILISIILALIVSIFSNLLTNKTFFKNTYVGIQKQEIFIPKYSFFKDECCMTVANFYSLKSEKKLKKEIDNYLQGFKYFEDDTTYGYRKDDLFIQNYEVVNHGFYRTIHITY